MDKARRAIATQEGARKGVGAQMVLETVREAGEGTVQVIVAHRCTSSFPNALLGVEVRRGGGNVMHMEAGTVCQHLADGCAAA